jgi:hypothetical protein
MSGILSPWEVMVMSVVLIDRGYNREGVGSLYIPATIGETSGGLIGP